MKMLTIQVRYEVPSLNCVPSSPSVESPTGHQNETTTPLMFVCPKVGMGSLCVVGVDLVDLKCLQSKY